MTPAPRTAADDPDEDEYPSSDGEPMAETGIHVQAIMLLHQALEDVVWPADTTAYICSDQFWYYRHGEPNARVAPDVMVVPGAGPHPRRSYRVWRETVQRPAVVFEMASESNWEYDIGGKLELYRSLGVPEYFVFDPEWEYLQRPLLGFRLRRGRYAAIRATGGRLRSDLGFGLAAEGLMLRVYDADGRPVPTRAEHVEQERERADGLQAEVERLRALLRRHGHANGNGP